MIFAETVLKGAFLIEPEPRIDERGFFARSWCQREFEACGLDPPNVVQCNISYNKHRGTLRGMHYQIKPHEEAKLVRCTRGALYDVILDLRPTSVTFKMWVAYELTANNYQMVYVPPGLANGFQTLKDDTEVFYQMSEFYVPELARGVRWNDPAFSIEWPVPNPIISARDQAYPDFVV